jgi:hypothetical protein
MAGGWFLPSSDIDVIDSGITVNAIFQRIDLDQARHAIIVGMPLS